MDQIDHEVPSPAEGGGPRRGVGRPVGSCAVSRAALSARVGDRDAPGARSILARWEQLDALLPGIHPDAWLTFSQLGLLLGFTYERVRQFHDQGFFPSQMVGGVRMIRGTDAVTFAQVRGPNRLPSGPAPQAVIPVVISAHPERLASIVDVIAQLGHSRPTMNRLIAAGSVSVGRPGHRQTLVDPAAVVDAAGPGSPPPAVARRFASRSAGPAAHLRRRIPGAEGRSVEGMPLSRREREVCSLAITGMSNAQIGKRLGLTMNCVCTYRTRGLEKMGVQEVGRRVIAAPSRPGRGVS